jgi:hypothetical protein
LQPKQIRGLSTSMRTIFRLRTRHGGQAVEATAVIAQKSLPRNHVVGEDTGILIATCNYNGAARVRAYGPRNHAKLQVWRRPSIRGVGI